MLNTDDFLILIPNDGAPRLLSAGDDLSGYVGHPGFFRANETVVLSDGRNVKGSIIRLRNKTATDAFQTVTLLNRHFRKPHVGEPVTLPHEDGPGTVPSYEIEKVLEPVDGHWIVEIDGAKRCVVRSDTNDDGELIVWLGSVLTQR